MNFCPYCGTQLLENSMFCQSCGNALPSEQSQESKPIHMQVQTTASVYRTSPMYETLTPYQSQSDSGGMIAWGIISVILCLIPGIIGLVYACKIKTATSDAEEARYISNAKAANIIATVLGICIVLETCASLT